MNRSRAKAEYFRISIADKKIEIECHNRTVFRQCKDYLCEFDSPDLRIAVPMDELEAGASELPPIEKFYKGAATTRFYGIIESLLVYEKIAEEMISYNTILMHGAAVAYNGAAYIFIAPSGVGKTTRIKIWLDTYPDSIVINGDKPLIRVDESKAVAYGTPWCGKEGWNTNTKAPIDSIFLLERVNDGEESSIEDISIEQAFPILLQQTYRPKDVKKMIKTIQILKALDGKVKIYRFRSKPSREAICLAYETACLR